MLNNRIISAILCKDTDQTLEVDSGYDEQAKKHVGWIMEYIYGYNNKKILIYLISSKPIYDTSDAAKAAMLTIIEDIRNANELINEEIDIAKYKISLDIT